MKTVKFGLLALLITLSICYGDLFVYEPFDYHVHNHEVMGRLEGRDGGIGFAEPWMDTASEKGYAFVYDQRGNQEDLYDGAWGEGRPDWDGVVDNLPTMGGYVALSDWDQSGMMHSSRKLSQSAGSMAKANGGVLWLSSVWHLPAQTYFAPVGIALASNGSGFKERAVAMHEKADAIGVGNGIKFRERGKLNPLVWKAGEEVAGTTGPKIDGTKDNIIIIKFEFGETDRVSTWSFAEDEEMTAEAFNENAVSCRSSIDEGTLEYVVFATMLKPNAIDEIRMGTTFKSVISGSIPARQDVKILKVSYDRKSDRYTLAIASNPGEIYGLYLAEDAGGYKPCIAAAVKAEENKTVTTFGPFPNPRKGNGELKFEIGLPDTTAPSIKRVWGSGTNIRLLFSEPMLPTTALNPINYSVEEDGAETVVVKDATYDRSSGSIKLTLEKPLTPDSSYTITTRNLSDPANNRLTRENASLRTWDDDPKGVKVFILAGQSNMVGFGHTEKTQHGDGGPGCLRYLAMNNSKYPEYDYTSLLADPSQPATSAWKTQSMIKLWWRNSASVKLGGPVFKGDLGPLTSNGRWFGPEYGFGQVIGDYYKSEDVLIIKTAWGGHNLVADFRSPNAVATRGGEIGASYIELFDNVREVLFNLGAEFPEWEGRGYQIVGFGWHQGTSDKAPDIVADEYRYNLPDFISSVRSEFGKPDLPLVIATTGMSGVGPVEPYPYEGYHPVEKAQLWVAGVDQPENVLTDDTRGYFEEADVSPRTQSYHWNGNARSYFRVGYGLGTNMVKLLEAKK